MKFILVDISEINGLNVFDNKKLSPVETIHGWVLNEDILTDEETWGFAFEYLKSCPIIEVSNEDFIKPEI